MNSATNETSFKSATEGNILAEVSPISHTLLAYIVSGSFLGLLTILLFVFLLVTLRCTKKNREKKQPSSVEEGAPPRSLASENIYSIDPTAKISTDPDFTRPGSYELTSTPRELWFTLAISLPTGSVDSTNTVGSTSAFYEHEVEDVYMEIPCDHITDSTQETDYHDN